ncbi:MAG TPA: hypothetical protein VFR37_16725, partial [Longimicrobium sp.]|nr:hypothetical protein [Longimicrobium sp.]
LARSHLERPSQDLLAPLDLRSPLSRHAVHPPIVERIPRTHAAPGAAACIPQMLIDHSFNT